jgi:DNA-binding transcriptional ArsR family regulator
MELELVAKALSNTTRLKVLQLVADQPDTAIGTFQRYADTYDDDKHRESIYRELGVLVDAEVLQKEYQAGRGLLYQLTHDRLLIDLHNTTVEPKSADDG